MSARRFIVALAALSLVGCSGSDDDPALVPDSIPDTVVSDDELRDGVFEPNEGDRVEGDPAVPASAVPGDAAPTTSAAPSSAVTTIPEATSTGGISGSSTTGTGGTTSGSTSSTGGVATGGTATGGASSTTGGATDSTTGGTDTGASTSGTTTGSATTGGTDGSNTAVGSTGEVEALTGKVTIGDDVYAFGFDRCNVDNDVTKAQGQSTLGDIPFIVRVTSAVLDIDDDGSSDTTIEINVETNPDAEGVFADFYVVGVDSDTITTEFDLDFSVTDDRITASGPIRDNNGVARPTSETLPMTLDIRCA